MFGDHGHPPAWGWKENWAPPHPGEPHTTHHPKHDFGGPRILKVPGPVEGPPGRALRSRFIDVTVTLERAGRWRGPSHAPEPCVDHPIHTP